LFFSEKPVFNLGAKALIDIGIIFGYTKVEAIKLENVENIIAKSSAVNPKEFASSAFEGMSCTPQAINLFTTSSLSLTHVANMPT
jgi:hypothetical protein